jgi:hypothetical protein
MRECIAENPAWGSEWRDVINAFCKIFPVKWKSYDLHFIEYTIGDVPVVSGIALHKHLMNNYWSDLFKPKYLGWVKGKAVHSKIQRERSCVLTGFCGDEDILDPIYNFLDKPNDNATFADLLRECMESFRIAYRNDYEGSMEDESMADTIRGNDYLFTAEGRRTTVLG